MSFTEVLLAYLAIGAVAGTFAGLLGVGGGTIVVPALLWVFARTGVDAAITLKLALGTSLGAIVFTSASSARTHHTHGSVRWDVVAKLTPGIVAGTALGAWLASSINGSKLLLLYVGFLLYVGLELLLHPGPEPRATEPGAETAPARLRISRAGLVAAGLSIGVASSLFGIGGGTLTVPLLVWTRLDIRSAIGSSAACGFPISIAGAVAYAWLGRGEANLPEGTLGFVHWQALASIAASSVFFAYLGARWANVMPRRALRCVFALLLLGVALKMWLGT